ncbi:hypothetical protein LTR36_009239 [Oleoguttula mirabilis]|uniref:Transaldolase n=1 Tax=Oleoguttula mirabilis TaxID=1507867 RepID=A0AAV9J6P1_9PEZI|nr:hypothetical protein LTR36_009239 [Oleoguttula mirabilis]
MGVDSRRPPLPAPTESMDETSGADTEVATTVTRATDKTSYEVPEDGSPITISTQKVTSGREGGRPGHHRQKSQTSLLIEYFEASKTGDKVRSRPSVRVKVTPSAARKSKNGGHDAIQITGIGKDRKPSYTRRISLGSSRNVDTSLAPTEGTEISHSSESNLSGRPPVEIEVLNHNGSDMSNGKSSRGLMYAHNESNVSSMPPDSMLEGSNFTESELSRDTGYDDDITVTDKDRLTAPIRSRSRSTSRDRITQKVMEKLVQTGSKPRKSSRSSHERSISKEYDAEGYPKEHRRRSSKSRYMDDETVSGAESSLLSSQLAPSQRSYRSGTSQGSRMTNNPKLLEMVEDTIKRMILPEINAIKEDQKTDRNIRSFDSSRGSLPRDGYESQADLQRRVSKSSSTPNISSKPKVVLNRDGDDPGTVLSRGDSERKNLRKSSRESYTEERPSSRRSSGRHSNTHGEDYDEDEQRVRHKSSKSSGHGLRNAAAAGMAGGILTAAALKHHDSHDNVHERRKKRTKSHGTRSRSASLAETNEEAHSHTRKEDIPPMPLASHINDSDITRDSIVSAATERPGSRASAEIRTPLREVSRGSVGDAMSPVSSRTPTRTPVSAAKRGLGMSHTNQSISGPASPISTKARMAALAAAGLGGVAAVRGYEEHEQKHDRDTVDADGYGEQSTQRSVASPVQSVSSLKQQFEDEDSPLVPQGLRPQSAASRSSAGRLRNEQQASESSLRSMRSSPTTQRLAQSRQHSGNVSGGDDFVTPLERPNTGFMRDQHSTPGTPTGESVDDWWQRQHQLNDQYRDSDQLENRYRDSLDETTNRDSYQTNPFPEDEKRFTQFTDDSFGVPALDGKRFTQYTDDSFGAPADSTAGLDVEQQVRGIAANPIYHAPLDVESNVASLLNPSTISSNMLSGSSEVSSLPANQNGTYANRMAEHLRDVGEGDEVAAIYEGSTLSQNVPSQDRWAAIKGNARNVSSANSQDNVRGGSIGSPRQSPAKSLREIHSREERVPVMGASGLPVADDPLPEIGHFDDTRSEVSTNPSVVKGPLDGDVTGQQTWPYTPEPERQQQEPSGRDSRSLRSGHSRDGGSVVAAAGGAAALAAAHLAAKQASVRDVEDDDRSLTPDTRQGGEEIDWEATPRSHAAAFPDEGYVTDAHARSVGALTPRAEHQRYGKDDVEEYNRAMDAHSVGEEDPFTGNAKHSRHLSGNSHGMASPLYDGATGKGLDRIQSHDIVALMDHLTVRDAQRNARDTEILVTLVRSSAEMRQSFDEMKRFIAEQDKLIMRNTDRDAEETVQKVQTVLGGPRPLPLASPRTPRRESQEEIQAKRKGVLRRALKGLTGGKKADDLARVEDMLMQILDNVEDLKHGSGVSARQPMSSYTTDTLDSYEKLRAAPDSGYEPEGQAGTSSTPSHSGHLSLTPRAPDKQQFHSGYDGRRNSVNRVSTVLEGDEDDLTPDEHYLLSHQAENNERLLTPTQEIQRQRGLSPSNTPPQHAATFGGAHEVDLTPKTAEKQRKHKSNGSSIFGVPKISRWSKTTTSSAAPDLTGIDSPSLAKNVRPLSSQASRSSSQLDDYDDEPYGRHHSDRLGSSQSLAREKERAMSQSETRSMRSQGSRITRTPSPLIPSETSLKQHDEYDDDERGASPIQQDLDHEFDDPKYQAHRNSLLLQHPQPRQGATGRHQSQLETQAHLQNYPGDVSGTSSDVSQRTTSDFDPTMWGSSGTAALARNRFSQAEQPLSPASLGGGRAALNDGPLVPQQQKQKAAPAIPPKIYEPEPDSDWEREPQYSNSGFSKGGYYSSPFGSGHLLEPIEEVRYSLETDRGVSPEPQVSSAKAVDMRSSVRKITGPRPMGNRSPGPQAKIVENNGTVRRKPVARSQASLASEDSLQSDGF